MRDRQAVQRADVLPGRQRGVGGVGGRPRALGVEGDDGVDGRVEPLDPVEVRVEQLARGDLAGRAPSRPARSRAGSRGRRRRSRPKSLSRPRLRAASASRERWRRWTTTETPPPTAPPSRTWACGRSCCAALTALGYEEPTPIQQEAIPPLVAGRDLLGQAATGTGKTAAFALPMLQRLTAHRPRARRRSRLVLVPTRELAVQVSEALHRYGRDLGARVLPVYGGAPIVRQLRALESGVDVVVATPGRALDLLSRGSLQLGEVATVVLDEADEMLDMGFAEDLEAILDETPETRQTVLFSATMPRRLDSPRPPAPAATRSASASAARRAGRGEAPRVRQTAYVVPRAAKPAALGRILDVEAPTAAIVFCRTREEVDALTETLNGRGYRAEALHGGMSQEQRDRVMGRLRGGTADLLVATDVAARGLDIEQLTHVVNYDVPSAPESYVHRIGRVGRAGREGVAITLAEPREHRMLKTIERVAGAPIVVEKVPTVADLRARRLDLTRAALRESLLTRRPRPASGSSSRRSPTSSTSWRSRSPR